MIPPKRQRNWVPFCLNWSIRSEKKTWQKRKGKKMHLLKGFLIFLALLSVGGVLLSCGATLQVTTCGWFDERRNFRCHDQRKNESFNLEEDKSEGLKCRHLSDFRNYQVACKNKVCPLPKTTDCQVKPQVGGAICKSPDGSEFSVLFGPKLEEYLCHPEVDFDTIISYCSARCQL